MNCRMISASMMCSSLVELEKTIRIFENHHIEYLHIDVMDGTFVPNFGLGVDYIRGLRELTNIPLDLHLMIDNPEYKLDWIGIQSTDIVSIHYESTNQVQRVLDKLHKYGCKCFIAINPATPIWVLEEVLDFIDGINLLMVNPGFAGQKMVPSTMEKAIKLRKFLDQHRKSNLYIEADGNITPEHACRLSQVDANIYVGGTSSIFRNDPADYGNNIVELRRAMNIMDSNRIDQKIR